MIVAIHQPHYLPWLRYVDKIARSDVFVLLDDAQYTKNGWQNRNRIKSAQGWMYLTVPVMDAFAKPISAVRVDAQQRWRDKHWNALCTNYARAPYFRQFEDALRPLFAERWDGLCDVSIAMLERILPLIGRSPVLVRSSQLDVPGAGTERLVRICRRLGARTYLTGDYAATNHLDLDVFKDSGIDVERQAWRCATYEQQFPRAGFIPDLSIVDLMFNAGPATLAVLERSRESLQLAYV